jgi:hypothetical protein
MLHVETLKYFPFPLKIIIIHSMDYEKQYMNEINQYNHKRIQSFGHYIGPLLSAIEGIRVAHELGCKYAVYKNCDDILYNYNFEQENFNKLENDNYLCAGYNWLNVGTYHDITLNQVYFNVPAFEKTANDAEAYFLRSAKNFLCEYKMARWVKNTCPDIKNQFYRLPGREQEPGIGWERKDIYGAFASKSMNIPVGFWEKLEKNNRFFNHKWQMIGSHDNASRLIYWRKIRGEVPYSRKIEKDKHFTRFLESTRTNKQWNLPDRGGNNAMPPNLKQPKIISRKIF